MNTENNTPILGIYGDRLSTIRFLEAVQKEIEARETKVKEGQ